MTVRYEIQINAVPRSYRDVLQVAIESAQYLKVRNPKDEVRLVDLETRKWMLIKDDRSTPEWREPGWEPSAKPLEQVHKGL